MTGYRRRSEGVRDIVREAMCRLNSARSVHKYSVGNLSYIYDRRVRRLASRLSDLQHAHHDLIACSASVTLDHSSSLESVVLKGPTKTLSQFADSVRTERGVRSVMLNLIGDEPGDRHEHKHGHTHTGHAHLSPKIS